MKIKITFQEEILGTKPSVKDLFDDYVAKLAPDEERRQEEMTNAEKREEELEAQADKEAVGTTVFHRVDGKLGIYDYQLKGFFKDACGAMNRFDKEYRNGLEKLSAYKTKIDGCIFVFPRFAAFNIPEGLAVGSCQRPLLADTPQGRRVTLVRSEAVPPGSTLEFEVKIFAKDLIPYVQMWLQYGVLRGLGQWRNSGKGRFSVIES